MKRQPQNSAPLLRYCVGIDVGKDTLHLCVSAIDADGRVSVKGSSKSPNRVSAFGSLEAWIDKHCKDKSLPVRYLMESTGVYHEQIAWHLFRADRQVCVVLPNKAKHYSGSLGHKSKNDKIDARGLAQMGLDGAARAAEPPAVGASVEGDIYASDAHPPAAASTGTKEQVPQPAARDHAQPNKRPFYCQTVGQAD